MPSAQWLLPAQGHYVSTTVFEHAIYKIKFFHSYKNYDKFLSDILKHRWKSEHGRSNPLAAQPNDPHGDFWKLHMRQKVEVLHALCDFRLDAADVVDVLKVIWQFS
jgi:hypothetical protein